MHLACVTTLAMGANESGFGGAASAASLRLQAASARMTINGTRMRMVSSSGLKELLFQRELADPLACRCEDCVRNRRSRHRRSRLADPARRLEIAHQVHFDLRRLVDAQGPIVVEVGLPHPALL